jgi:predicted glycosyltransferase
LTAVSLSAAIDRALSLPLGSAQEVALDGAEKTAEIIRQLFQRRQERVGTG